MLHAKSICTDSDCGTAFIKTTSGLRKDQMYTNTLLSVAKSGAVKDRGSGPEELHADDDI